MRRAAKRKRKWADFDLERKAALLPKETATPFK